MQRKWMCEKGQGVVEVALMLLLVSVVTSGVLVAMGPQVGGVFSEAHAALSGVIAPAAEEVTPVAMASPTPTATPTLSPATPTPTPTLPPLPPAGTPVIIPTVPPLPPTATPTPTPAPTATSVTQCSGFSFDGRLLWLDRDGDGFSEALLFGLAYVNSGDYGPRDPLVRRGGYMTWHFIGLGAIRLTGRYTESADGFEFEVDPTPVSLQIASLGKDPVLVGKVSFNTLRISDRQATMTGPALNVSQVRIRNDINSSILRAFEESDQAGLVLDLRSNPALAKHILRGHHVNTSFTATMRPAVCH
ncbi:MAG: hypothetical protein H5T62_00530 [Anaerolineae bacterium]|nr:hypothetical protein [Anaerolineae bacterium]